jgi:hypothetical protein
VYVPTLPIVSTGSVYVVLVEAEIEQLRALMKAGTLSPAVAQSAIETAESEIRATERMQPAKEE